MIICSVSLHSEYQPIIQLNVSKLTLQNSKNSTTTTELTTTSLYIQQQIVVVIRSRQLWYTHSNWKSRRR